MSKWKKKRECFFFQRCQWLPKLRTQSF